MTWGPPPIVSKPMTQATQIPVLRFVSGKYKGQQFPLDDSKSSFVAGRSSEADLMLADDAVSRKHARFFHRRGRTWLRDLGSRNGTHVNGASITKVCLRSGDRIAIGASLLKVVMLEASRARSGLRAGERKVAEQVAGRSMSGSMEDIPLVDVLQWLATSRKTGTLKVRTGSEGRMGAVYLREGRVFYARIDGGPELHPQKALMRMLLWNRGTFELDAAVDEEVPVEIGTSLEHMLMEAARQSDELANLAQKAALPDEGAQVDLVRPSPVRWRELEPQELDIVQGLAEGRSWWELLDTSDTDDVTLTQTLTRLHKRGAVHY